MITDASGVCDACGKFRKYTMLIGRQQLYEPGTARMCRVCLLNAVEEIEVLYGTGTGVPLGVINAKGVEKR